MTLNRLASLSLVATVATVGLLSACSPAKDGSEELTNAVNTFTPAATDYQGAAMQLGSDYKGQCTFKYKSGAQSSACTAELQASEDASEVSLVLVATIDGQQHTISTGNYRIYGNRIQDDRGANVGSIGQTALRLTSTEYGSLSVKFLSDGSIGVLVNDFSDLPGDHSKGAAFAAKMKLPGQN